MLDQTGNTHRSKEIDATWIGVLVILLGFGTMIVSFSNVANKTNKATSSRAEVSNMNTLDSGGTPVPTPTITFVTWSGTWFGETVPAGVSMYCKGGIAGIKKVSCQNGYTLDYSSYGSCWFFGKHCRPKNVLDQIFFLKSTLAAHEPQEYEWVERADAYCRQSTITNNPEAKCLDYFDEENKKGYKKLTVNMWGKGIECPNMRVSSVKGVSDYGSYIEPGQCYIPE